MFICYLLPATCYLFVKTLGVKFQVAGVKEAQAGLNNLKKTIEKTVNEARNSIHAVPKAIETQASTSVKIDLIGVRELNSQLNNLNRSVDRNIFVFSSRIKSFQQSISRGFEDWRIENFGSKVQKQNLIIKREAVEFKQRSTYKQLGSDNRGLILEFRLAYKDFFTRLEENLEELKPEKTGIGDRITSFVGGGLSMGLNAALFPFQSALAGAFERMGEVQVQDFAEGFNKNLQRSLGLSFEETGGDVGNTIGKSLYKVYQKSIDAVDDYVKGRLKFNLADTLIEAMTGAVKTLAKETPALILRTHRRIQLNKKAIPEARAAAGLKMIENDLPEATRKDIENNKSISLIYGGANTDSADIGKDYTARVMKPYLKGSAVIPMTRSWTNSAVDSDFQGDIKNLIKLIMSNPVTAGTFKGFVSENGLNGLPAREREELMAGLDLEGELDLSSIERIAEIVESLINNKDFSLGKSLQATFQGYNPDDVLGAAEAIALMEQFPDKDLQVGGFSQGGYNALGVVDLLNRMGYENVKGFSIGTPITGANATVNPDNFRSFMGDRDYYYTSLTGLAEDEIDFPEFFSVGEKEGSMHSLQGYVRGDSVKGGLQEFLGDRVSIPSKDEYGKHDSAYGYAVGELGAETGLIRTLLKYLGEKSLGAIDSSDGFVFSAESSLPGYTANIEKLGKDLKDEDTKEFHAKYISFLKTLQKELEIAEQFAAIGKQYKPTKSLAKAAEIFPQLESVAQKHIKNPENNFAWLKESRASAQDRTRIEETKSEVDSKKRLVAFVRKVNSEKDNIERTFQAMLGRKFSKKDESKGIYSFYNSEEYESRASGFEGMVNWLENDVLGGASESEIEQAKPTLDLLKKITQSIRDTGSTGQLDLETVREAEKLLGIDLKEFNLLFKEFEKSGQKSVDVNHYKDELRTARRNRDQILNEKKTPPQVASVLNTVREKIADGSGTIPETKSRPPSGKPIPLSGDATPAKVLQSLSREAVEAYNNHLASIIKASNTKAVEDLKAKRANIDTDAEYKQLKTKIKEYRKVVKDGQFQRARELGEAILNESEYLRELLLENESSKKAQLTRMQTEIVSGDAGIGRSSVGLGELPSVANSVQFELDFEPTTRQTADGAKENLNRESGNVIGSEFAEGIIEGATNELDIQSPSRVFQWIGSMVKAGFTKGVANIDEPLSEEVESVTTNILAAYKKYLRSLKGYRDIEMEMFAENKLSEYGDLDPAQKSEYAQKFGSRRERSMESNTEQLNDYREAVDTGNLKAAKEIAEDLLGEVNSLKVAYQQIADSLPEGDEFKGVAENFLAHLDSVEVEILEGNESLRSLPDILSESSRLEEFGGEAAEDFARGVEANLDEVRESGEQITRTFSSGIDPSPIESAGVELSQTLGETVSDAVGEATDSVESEGESLIDSVAEWVSDVASELDDSPGLLDPLLETEGADEAVNDFFGNLVSQVSDVFDSLTERFPILGRISNLLMSIGGEVLQVLGIFSFGEALIEFSNQALQTAMEVESLERSIRAVSRSASDGVNNIKFIRNEARRLSIDLITAEEAYKRILGATRSTPLEGLQTEQIFSTLATTAKNRGLNADATSRLFLGFEQAIAKQEFRSEEVRGQLAEVMGDIQNLLATSVGVPTSQLGELMEAGDLKVVEVMPKLLAQLDAQNAAIGDSAGTAAAAQTRFNNAILEYQDAVGRQMQPVQKMGLNALAAVIETLRDRATEIAKLVASFFITVLVNLTLRLLASSLATAALGDAIYRLGFALGSVLPKLILFLKRFVLITAAIEVWTNVVKLAKHPLPELDARVENSTKRLDALRKAFDGAGDAATGYGKKFGTLQLNEGMDLSKMPGWVQKIAGGDRLNLDNLIRNRLNKLYDFPDGNLLRYGPLGHFVKKKGTTTQAQRKQNTFISDSSELIADVDSTLSYGNQARGVLDEIAELDKKARDLESKRLNILPGDSEVLKAALVKEQELQQERDKLLKKSSQYAESLQGDIQAITETLGELDELDKMGGSEEEVMQRTRIRDSLEERLGLLEEEKKAIDEINSRIPDFLSQIDRLLRNIDIKVRGFIAGQDDDAIAKRTEIIERAIREGTSEVDLEIQLDDLSATDLEDRMAFLAEQIEELEKNLNSAYLTEGVTGLERAAEEQGMGELTSAAIEELLTQSRTSQETKAGNLLLALDEYEGMVAQSQSELVDLIKNNRDKLIDYNRTVSDYFERITQQIKEAALETQRLISQILYTDIKNTLRRAIAPGSNTFVNGVIDNIQSVLDGASAVAQKAFGDSSAQLSFEMEVQTLTVEMNEFIRQIISAGDALSGLVKRLNGYSQSSRGDSDDAPTEDIGVGRPDTEPVRAWGPGESNRSASLGAANNIGNANNEAIPVDPDKSGYYKNPVTNQHKDYITKILKQPAGVDTGVEQMLSLIQGDPSSPRLVPQVLSIVSDPQTPPPKLGGAASELNDRLIERKRFNLELQKYTTEQERSAFEADADNIIETNRRSIEQSIKESQRTLIDLEGKFEDFSFQYDYASAGNELKKALRDVKTTFLDTNSGIDTQIQNTVDAINTIENLAQKMPGDIARLRSYGTSEALKLADVKQSGLNELLATLPKLQNNLAKIKHLQNDSGQVESLALEFTERQGELKIEIEAIDKKSAIAQLKSNLALEVGTIEQIKQIKLEQERYRLKTAIANIELNEKPSPERDELISNERKQSILNTENIGFESRLSKLDLEKQSIDYQSSIGDKKAGFLSRVGFDLKADAIKKGNAIASEDNRFRRELLELEKKYRYQPELLEEFTRAATELNSVNLAHIENEFRSLGKTIEDNFISSTQNFSLQFVSSGFDFTAQREKAVLEERLRYAEQLNSLENQYREQPGQLAHMKNRARELNEEKLDKIRNEFNLFSRTVDLAKQAIVEFIKQLAAMVAKQAAAKFISSVLGGAIGGSGGGGDVTAIGSAFVADKGVTVGERKISDRNTSILRRTFPGIKSAWTSEGSDAQLGVFHTGEELLSRKTGEAGRYQMLKRELGINPLDKILNYSDGGTIPDVGSNILSGIPSNRPRIDLTGIEGRRQRADGSSNKTINISQTIVSPDADSFRLNEDQRNQDLMERLRRGI